ncbi:multidrug effflux MFS transporter [uncultured Sphingomonas sp.]|uniref:multidrug effflux MFS transporter n=1 Tax=uncultured Sphingomonas sp. TaxID=158754 RepID=UPI0035CC63C1
MTDQTPPQVGAPIGFAEFVSLIAALLALGALGIDAMLPALPAIGEALGITDPNARQYVIAAFIGGYGVGQLFYGPLADRFGRRRVLLWSMGVYAVANIAAAVSGSFELLIASRAIGGVAIAATRVATVAMVRDCYHGPAMARVMSIAFMMFMVVPIIAPALGEAVLLVAGWREIFWVIAGLSAALFGWFWLRMPETLAPEHRQPISLPRILAGWRETAADRLSLGYTLAAAALMGALYGYINSVQQIMADTFGRPEALAAVFAGTAGTMAIANLLNARLVMRLGTRLISHGAVIGLIGFAGLHLLLVELGREDFWSFAVLQALTMACFGLGTSNFSAMAMQNMGRIAGTASSVQGFTSVTMGAAIGAMIGQAFDGTTVPMSIGFMAAGLAALGLMGWTERGRLFGR